MGYGIVCLHFINIKIIRPESECREILNYLKSLFISPLYTLYCDVTKGAADTTQVWQKYEGAGVVLYLEKIKKNKLPFWKKIFEFLEILKVFLPNAMLPFAHGHAVDYFADERKYAPKFAGRNPPKRNKDHEVVLIPLSPSRSAGAILQNFAKSRLAWLIIFLILVVITLSYHAYEERMKQLRLLGYMERVEELKASMSRVKHHILAGNNKVQELKQIVFVLSSNSSVNLT